MILIDSRTGSKELAKYFPNHLHELCRLEFGDLMLMGNGPDGPAPIGIERKAIRDLVSSMARGRLSGHQLPGLLNMYSYVYLVVEGLWRPCPRSGILQVWGGNRGWTTLEQGSRRFMAKEIYNYLNTLEVMSGVMIRQTSNMAETAALVLALHTWWNKQFEDHTSHIDVHKGGMIGGLQIRKPSLLLRVASELPGIGSKRARDVAKRFPSILDMVLADEGDWQSIDGIGKKTAITVTKSIRGEITDEC